MMTIRLVTEDEQPVLEVAAEFTPGRPPGAKPGQDLRQLISIKGPFPIERPGAYKLQAVLDGEPQEPPFRFWVDKAE